MGAFGASDPVALQQADALRPIQAVEFVDQALSKGGDAQHPLAHGAALDRESADFAFAIHDFFIGQNGAELWAPVDGGLTDVGEAAGVDLRTAEALRFEF